MSLFCCVNCGGVSNTYKSTVFTTGKFLCRHCIENSPNPNFLDAGGYLISAEGFIFSPTSDHSHTEIVAVVPLRDGSVPPVFSTKYCRTTQRVDVCDPTGKILTTEEVCDILNRDKRDGAPPFVVVNGVTEPTKQIMQVGLGLVTAFTAVHYLNNIWEIEK